MDAKVVDLHQRLWNQGRSGELPVAIQIRLLERAFARRRAELAELKRELELDSYWQTVAPHNIVSLGEDLRPMLLKRQAG
jgi:hypothetical protein